jgi:hypothetical protein
MATGRQRATFKPSPGRSSSCTKVTRARCSSKKPVARRPDGDAWRLRLKRSRVPVAHRAGEAQWRSPSNRECDESSRQGPLCCLKVRRLQKHRCDQLGEALAMSGTRGRIRTYTVLKGWDPFCVLPCVGGQRKTSDSWTPQNRPFLAGRSRPVGVLLRRLLGTQVRLHFDHVSAICQALFVVLWLAILAVKRFVS